MLEYTAEERMEYRFKVEPEDHGKRAVDVLVQRHRFSRLQTKKIRLYGELSVNGRPQRMIDPLHKGEWVELSYRADEELPEGLLIEAQEDIPIFYQDEWFLLAGKPAGLLTHPSYTGESESLITRLSPYRLHPVTRLDRDTSGLVLLAKSGLAHYALGGCVLKKYYLAYVFGTFLKDEGIIDAPIARTPGSIIEREVHPQGKASRTAYRCLKRYAWEVAKADGRAKEADATTEASNVNRADHSLQNESLSPHRAPVTKLRCELLSGRTHQIRVHCRHSGHALLGDSLYPLRPEDRSALLAGGTSLMPGPNAEQRLAEIEKAALALGRQALHAAELSFIHPFSGAALHFEMPLPEELVRLEQILTVRGRAR